MQGRWTLILAGPDEPVGILTDPTEDPFTYSPSGGVPVVPCDDEAIERAAHKLHELDHRAYRAWENQSKVERTHWLELAKHVLRAAGETP